MFTDNPFLYVALTVLAFVATEGVVEYLLGEIFKRIEKLAPYSWTLKYASAAVGVFLTFYYALDAMTLVGLPASPVGTVITGVIVGRGANVVHDLFSLIAAKRDKAYEEVLDMALFNDKMIAKAATPAVPEE